MDKHPRQLDASVETSEPHDFVVRISVIRPRKGLRLTLPRPPHPTPNVRDDRETPLVRGAGRLESIMLLLANGEAKYFLRKGWTRPRNSL
jgi:hypothetical protein